MLLALVCIAALLVPISSPVEKWATEKLVEKNKKNKISKCEENNEKLEGS